MIHDLHHKSAKNKIGTIALKRCEVFAGIKF